MIFPEMSALRLTGKDPEDDQPVHVVILLEQSAALAVLNTIALFARNVYDNAVSDEPHEPECRFEPGSPLIMGVRTKHYKIEIGEVTAAAVLEEDCGPNCEEENHS